MGATAKETTAVARPERGKVLDLTTTEVSKKFLDAYSTGKLDRLDANQQAAFLFALGERIGVRPELGELMIYQGKPYITIDGRVRLAHESGLLVGMDTRPATQTERRDYGVETGDALWVAVVYRRGATRGFRGWGHVPANDRNPVAKQFPRELAKKRAKYDSLRVAFPPAEHVGEMHQRYIEDAERQLREEAVTPRALAPFHYEDEPAETVDEMTGEVIASDGVPGSEEDAPRSTSHRMPKGGRIEDALTPKDGELPLGDPLKQGSTRIRD